VIEADLWQLGQLKAGDKVRFVAVDVPTARRLAAGRRAELATLQAQDVAWQPVPLTSPVVMTCGDADKRLVARLSGDTHLLLEAGEAELDLVLRFRIHALMQALEGKPGKGSSISRRGSARCSCISSRKRWRWRPCWRGSAGSGPRSA
jgi:urea carboxylase